MADYIRVRNSYSRKRYGRITNPTHEHELRHIKIGEIRNTNFETLNKFEYQNPNLPNSVLDFGNLVLGIVSDFVLRI